MPNHVAAPSSRVPIGLWALVLGATGFAAGFFGPIWLNPQANQGPLVGIFITGPGGAAGGLLLGALFRFLPVSNVRRLQALALACAALALGTLYFCLPPPAVLGYVIDAEVAECAPPRQSAAKALARWQNAVAQATWVTPPADWQETAKRNLDRDSGVVLTMRIARRSAIYQHRKPWDSGRKSAGPWTPVETPERYYARDAGGECGTYLARSRALYMPFVEQPSTTSEPAKSWPPTDTTSFLLLMELGPVPEEYRSLLR